MEIWLHITEMALEIHKRKLVCICIVSMKIEIMLPTLSIAHIIRYQPMKWNSIHLKRETIPNPRFLGLFIQNVFTICTAIDRHWTKSSASVDPEKKNSLSKIQSETSAPLHPSILFEFNLSQIINTFLLCYWIKSENFHLKLVNKSERYALFLPVRGFYFCLNMADTRWI